MIGDSSTVVVSSEFLVFHRAVIQSFSFYFSINIFCSSRPQNLCPEGLYNQFVALYSRFNSKTIVVLSY